MKYARFTEEGVGYYGIIEDGWIEKISGSYFEPYQREGVPRPLEQVSLDIPCLPSKIVCIGKNYAEHIKEFDSKTPENPIIFLKPATACLAHEGVIQRPTCARTDYEAELGVVIGKTCRNISEKEAGDYIFGYTCLNDVTARDFQKMDGQWTRAKGFDTFCPIGPWIVKLPDAQKLRVQSMLNGKIMQDSNTECMIYKIDFLISFISQVMTLLPGDVVATGTPSGVGPLSGGDVVEVKIEQIGTLRNRVK